MSEKRDFRRPRPSQLTKAAHMSHSHAHLLCILPHGFLSKREIARSLSGKQHGQEVYDAGFEMWRSLAQNLHLATNWICSWLPWVRQTDRQKQYLKDDVPFAIF